VDDKDHSVVTTSDSEKSQLFCRYFSTVFNTDYQDPDIIPDRIVTEYPDTGLIINVEMVKKKLNNLNVNKSQGPDGIHPRILKELSNVIAYPLTKLYISSLKNQCLPTDWKISNISAIHKKGNRKIVSNYRPVSLTSVVCKVIESIVRDHIMDYFIKNKLFSNCQHGFIKNRSTVTQLLKVLDKWTELLELGGQIDVIYTDLEKAFDKVPHKFLLKKLSAYNIDKDLVKWIKSFLLQRMQRVVINGHFSDWVKVVSGIPQGSVLGPLLFIIYINDLAFACDSGSHIYLYADDAKIFNHAAKDDKRCALQKDLDKLNEWIKKWLLKLNINKCKIVSYGRSINLDAKYKIDNTELERVESFKDLGVTFDQKLTFSIHIDEKVNKAYSMLGVIKRNFQFQSVNPFLLIYKSMVRSHLEYANTVWCPHRILDIERLEKVQMRATKLIKAIRHLPYEERLRHLKLPTLKYRRLRGDMIEVFKIITGKYDKDIAVSLTKQVVTHTRGNSCRLYQGHVKYDLRKHFFTNRVINIWNSLPENVVAADNINLFKTRLDEHWKTQSVLFDWTADLAGVRSRSFVQSV
jgi:ribonuclease P/MRP protein subunit RPP40